MGAAFATKFSAFALPPILLALSLVVALRPESLPVAIGRAREVTGRGAKLLVLVGTVVVIGALALVVVWGAYGFQSALTPDPAVDAFMHEHDAPPAGAALRIGAAVARGGHLLPEAWVWGFLNCFKSFASRPSFLLGEYSDTGWWYYFPVAIALKAPLALLVLVIAAAVLAWTQPAPGRAQWFVWLPPALFLALTMTQNINIGHRHVLAHLSVPLRRRLARARPLAWSARARWRTGGGGGPRPSGTRPASLRVHPNYLAYFNEAAGGPAQGWRWLVDSNVDWGQELPGLKRYMDANGIARVTLCYFGTADPAYYGIAADRLPSYQPPPPSTLVRAVHPGDVVAISATHLQGLYLDPEMQPLMALFRARTARSRPSGTRSSCIGPTSATRCPRRTSTTARSRSWRARSSRPGATAEAALGAASSPGRAGRASAATSSTGMMGIQMRPTSPRVWPDTRSASSVARAARRKASSGCRARAAGQAARRAHGGDDERDGDGQAEEHGQVERVEDQPDPVVARLREELAVNPQRLAHGRDRVMADEGGRRERPPP